MTSTDDSKFLVGEATSSDQVTNGVTEEVAETLAGPADVKQDPEAAQPTPIQHQQTSDMNHDSDSEGDSTSRGLSGSTSITSHESFLKRRLRKHLQTGVALYKIPTARYKWGEKQGHAHHVWASLFFDLAYVGIAFQLGNLLAAGVKQKRIVASVGLFIAIFTILEMCWQIKLGFDSRFHADDLFHRVFQITMGALVTFTANSISTLEVMENRGNPHTLAFSCCMLAFQVLDYIPNVEMFFSPASNVRNMAVRNSIAKTAPLLLSVGSVVSAVYAPLWVTALLWFLIGSWLKMFIVILALTNIMGKESAVPMHGTFLPRVVPLHNMMHCVPRSDKR